PLAATVPSGQLTSMRLVVVPAGMLSPISSFRNCADSPSALRHTTCTCAEIVPLPRLKTCACHTVAGGSGTGVPLGLGGLGGSSGALVIVVNLVPALLMPPLART